MHAKRDRTGSPVQPPPALRRNYTVCSLLHDRASEERDASLSRLLGYKWAMLDGTDGSVREYSDGLASALGLAHDPNRLCGQRLTSYIAEADCAMAFEAAIANGEPLVCTVSLKRGSGEPADSGGGSEAVVAAEMHLAGGEIWRADGRSCRLCLVLDPAPADEAAASQPALARLADCLSLPAPFAPALRESLGALARTFLVTDPTQEDNPIVFASDVRCRACGRCALTRRRARVPPCVRAPLTPL